MPFKNRGLGEGRLLEKNRNSKIKKKKRIVFLYITRQHLLSRAQDWQQGPQAGRPGTSKGRSVVRLRQSAAHNWPVTSTQQNFIHARAGQESTGPLGIYKYLPDSLCLLQKQIRKLTADYLQTVSWDIVKADVGWLRGWGLWGQSSHSSPEGPRLGPLPRLQALQGTGFCYWERGLILLVEELHFVAQTSEKLIHSTLLSVREFL